MSTSRTIQDSINWARPFLKNMDVNVAPVNNPALDTANHVLQLIAGPPFSWPWNRASAALPVLINTQDSTTALSDFGFMELASIDGTTDQSFGELKIDNSLASAALSNDASQKGRPSRICLLIDDNAGNYTFRTRPVADAAYNAKIIYQKKPLLMQSLGALWTPLPDELAYIYDEGFLALLLAFDNDPMYAFYSQRFVAHLLGRAQGLSDMQKNIFLGDWLELTRMAQASTLTTQRGVAAMGA